MDKHAQSDPVIKPLNTVILIALAETPEFEHEFIIDTNGTSIINLLSQDGSNSEYEIHIVKVK